MPHFNSYPRVGGDSISDEDVSAIKISIRPPAWGVTRPLAAFVELVNNFNSHPRVGGDVLVKPHIAQQRISIRTPAWGVTFCDMAKHLAEDISIRTPAWGLAEVVHEPNFNSHPRVGGDSKNTQNSIQPFVHLRCFMRLLF